MRSVLYSVLVERQIGNVSDRGISFQFKEFQNEKLYDVNKLGCKIGMQIGYKILV